MQEPPLRIDLHLHSTASDGALAPDALVHAAAAGGLDVIAITDHDTTGGVAAARAVQSTRVHVIPGIEVSTSLDGNEVHILGYFIDPQHPSVVDYSRRAASWRRERMRQMIRLLDGIGVRIAYDDVLAVAGVSAESLGRPHLARALLERGYVQSHAEAFDRYIGNDAPAFLPAQLLDPAGAIALIHEAGGVAVWAHPRPDRFEPDLPRLVEVGLEGVGWCNTRAEALDALRMERVARDAGLLVTGGSDWHGEWHGPLGDYAVTRDEVGAFLDRGGI
jgi:predicted metal-dependent phosphoesterase TrpH